MNPALPKEIKSSFGNSAQQILEQDQNSLKAQRQRLAEVENQERVAQARAVERGREIAVKRGQIAEQIQNLARQSERARARIDAIQEEEQGTNLENEAELNRQKQLLKNYESNLEGKKKELAGLEKQSKEKAKIRAKDKKKIQAKIAEIERERNTIEERLNSTRRLDELEDDESRLKRLNEEDQAIIDDDNAPEFDKEAARERIASRDEDLLRLKAQISEREAGMPLRERIREIFKKYGVTVTAIFIAAGVLADLDPPRIGPPGPNPLADMDPPVHIR